MSVAVKSFDVSEACDHLLKPVARFGDLAVGEMFRFPGSHIKLVRVGSGYKYVDGRYKVAFKTGARVAVIPVHSEREN